MTSQVLGSLTDKQLSLESNRLTKRLADLSEERATLDKDFRKIQDEMTRRSRKPPEPHLTDHALLRYIERVFGVDVDAIKLRIMDKTVTAAIKNGASAVTVDGQKSDHVAKQASEVVE